MRAIRLEKNGGPEVLNFVDFELPSPGPREARVRHTAIGVNFIDTYHRSGLYPVPLPSGLGQEAAGVVDAVGAEVTDIRPGMRVAYAGGFIGAYSEAANVPAGRLVPLPDGVSDEVAAAALLKGMTAQYLLKRAFAVQPGMRVLIHAAAGGVGMIACQWARALGATVISTVGAPEKIALAHAHGAHHVVSTRDADWPAQVRAITGGAGVPVVYDGVGAATFEGSLDALAVRGMMVSFGNASGPVPPFSPGILAAKGSLFLTRPTLMHYARDGAELRETAADLFNILSSGAVTISVTQRFALKDAGDAHRALESRATTGATILIP